MAGHRVSIVKDGGYDDVYRVRLATDLDRGSIRLCLCEDRLRHVVSALRQVVEELGET